jgi:hypothetical protein
LSDQNARFQSLIDEACSAVLDERLEHAGVLLEAVLDDNFVPDVAEALVAIDRRRSGEGISRSEIVDKLRASGAGFARVEPSIKQTAATVEHRVVVDELDDDMFGASIEVDDSLISGSFASVGLNVSADDIDIFADEDFDSIASPVLRFDTEHFEPSDASQASELPLGASEQLAPQAAHDGQLRQASADDDDDGEVDFVVDAERDIISSEPSEVSPGLALPRSTGTLSEELAVLAEDHTSEPSGHDEGAEEERLRSEEDAEPVPGLRDEGTPMSSVQVAPVAEDPPPSVVPDDEISENEHSLARKNEDCLTLEIEEDGVPDFEGGDPSARVDDVAPENEGGGAPEREDVGALEIEAPDGMHARSASTGATVAVDGVDAMRYFEDALVDPSDEAADPSDDEVDAPVSPANENDEFESEPSSVIVHFDEVSAFDLRTNTPTGRSTEEFDVADIDELTGVPGELDVEVADSPVSAAAPRPQTALQQPSLGQESEEMIAAALESVERAILHDESDAVEANSNLPALPVSSPRYAANSPPPPAHRQPSVAVGASSAEDELDFELDAGFDPMRDTYEGPPGSGDWRAARANSSEAVKLTELSAPHLAVRPEIAKDSDAFEQVISFVAESLDIEVVKLLAEDDLDLGEVNLHPPKSPGREMNAESELTLSGREVEEEFDRNAQTPLPKPAGVVRHRRESSSREVALSASGEYSTVTPRAPVSGAGVGAENAPSAVSDTERLREVSGLMKRGDLATALKICDAVLASDPDSSVANEQKRAAMTQLSVLAMSRLEPLSRAPVGRPDRAIGMTNLTPKMMFVLTRADGHSTLNDLLDCSGLPRQEAAMVLVSLYENGLLID